MRTAGRTVLAAAGGTALFFLLARFVSITVFDNTTLTFQYALLAFTGAAYGPVAGLVIGFAGHLLTDLTAGGAVAWGWVLTSGAVGFAYGFVLRGVDIHGGELGKKGLQRFALGTLAIQGAGWLLLAPLLDMLLGGVPAGRAFAQGAVAAAFNCLTTLILGTLLLYLYARRRAKITGNPGAGTTDDC